MDIQETLTMSIHVLRKAVHTLCLTAPFAAYAADNQDLLPYPAAKDGSHRHVIHLDKQKNEDNFRVQVIVGKTMETDCNHASFGGDLRERIVQGWGYPYYEIEDILGPVSTGMACPDATRKQEFVETSGQGYLLRYNSKLPVVVYVPHGYEVRYRLWQASEQILPAIRQ
jgi:ecotin